MYKQTVRSILAGAALLCLAVGMSNATELKRSSLSMNKALSAAAKPIPAQCEKLFRQGEQLVSEAEKQPGTHTQLKQLKSKLSASKQQILKMDSEMQQKSCEKGLIALNTLKQQKN